MATETLNKFTFRTYSQDEEKLLKLAQEQFKEQSTTKAIKRALFYLFNEMPSKLTYYQEIEKKYNTLQSEHERLVEAIKTREMAEKEILKYIGSSNIK